MKPKFSTKMKLKSSINPRLHETLKIYGLTLQPYGIANRVHMT